MLRFMFFMFLACFLNAHNLEIFPEKNGDTLIIKSFMHGSDPCANCIVKIIKDDKVIHETKTDYKGYVEIKTNEEQFKILVTDNLTHQKTILFPLDRNSKLNIFVKFILAFAIIAAIFGSFYYIKRKK